MTGKGGQAEPGAGGVGGPARGPRPVDCTTPERTPSRAARDLRTHWRAMPPAARNRAKRAAKPPTRDAERPDARSSHEQVRRGAGGRRHARQRARAGRQEPGLRRRRRRHDRARPAADRGARAVDHARGREPARRRRARVHGRAPGDGAAELRRHHRRLVPAGRGQVHPRQGLRHAAQAHPARGPETRRGPARSTRASRPTRAWTRRTRTRSRAWTPPRSRSARRRPARTFER